MVSESKMRVGDRGKHAGRLSRYESQRIRIVLITMGCFLMTMTFILSTKPGAVSIENTKLDEAESLFPSPIKSKSEHVVEVQITQIKEDFQSNNVETKTEQPKEAPKFEAVAVDLDQPMHQSGEEFQLENARIETKPAEQTKTLGDVDSESQIIMKSDEEPKSETEKNMLPDDGESEKVVAEDSKHINIDFKTTLNDGTNTTEKIFEDTVFGNEETKEENSEHVNTKPVRMPTILDHFNENNLEIKPIDLDQSGIGDKTENGTDEKAKKVEVIPTVFDHIDKDPAGAKQTLESEQSRSEKFVDQWFVTNPHKTEKRSNFIHGGLQCDFTDFRSDTCNLEGDIRIHANSSTIYFVDPSGSSNQFYKIRPYPRKGDEMCNERVVEFNVTSQKEAPQCSKSFDVPAILFSIGGYTGNIFHDFSDVIMPLFTASRPFNGNIQFLMTDTQGWWLIKYDKILKALSHFEPIRLDVDDANNEMHCFKHVIVGLVAHRELIIEPLRNPNHYSTQSFTRFLREIFPLEREASTRLGEAAMKKPRMLIISRARSRMITNLPQLVGLGQDLGFEVLVKETDVGNDIIQFAQIINSCDVMIGVHGAGLTNEMFLPPNGTLIQILPYGGLDWIGQMDYGDPAIAMGLNYIQYNIALEESSLLEKYGRDNEILKNPTAFHKRGFVFIHEFFMNGQNITVNLNRFRNVLITTLNKLTY